jgi:hypothetical protein
MIRIRPMHPLMLVAVAVATVFTIYNETFWVLWSDVFDGNFPSGVKFAAAFFLLCCAMLGAVGFLRGLTPAHSRIFSGIGCHVLLHG